jgi:hypothetical protein
MPGFAGKERDLAGELEKSARRESDLGAQQNMNEGRA